MKRLIFVLLFLFSLTLFDYTTSSTTFVTVDPFALAFHLSAGQTCTVTFSGTAHGNTALVVYFDLSVNGIRSGGAKGLYHMNVTRSDRRGGFKAQLFSPVNADVRLVWKVSRGFATLRAGATLTCTPMAIIQKIA